MEYHPCGGNPNRVGSIQAKEVDTWLVIHRYICADIHLVKLRESWHWWHETRADVCHVKWHDANPALLLKSVEWQCWWDERAQSFWGNRPVSEEESVPCLGHDPWPARQRIGSMVNIFQYCRRIHSLRPSAT